MKLSVVIVNYNVCYFLEQCLKSTQVALRGVDSEILVVDNNSVDGSVEMVKEKFPDVTLIESEINLGFSKGNNLAIRQAKGEYVLLLNPDTFVEEDTLKKSCEFMDKHPDAGGLGIYMVDGGGEFLPESKRGLPTPKVAFYKISGLSRLFPKSEKFGKYHLGYLDKNKTHQIEVLSGAFMMMRMETLDKVGLLDEDYFMYGEDIDLSYRITKGGYKNYYYPEAKIIHYKGESTKRTSVNYVFVFYNAMIIFAKKHFSAKNAKLLSLLIYGAIYLKAALQITSNFLRNSFTTFLDAGLIFGSMYFLKDFWENNYKPVTVDYPKEFMTVAVPIYILIWLSSNHLSGGNDKPINLWKVLRGVLVGTIFISALTNFFDAYRFSKALLLIGGLATFISLAFVRWGEHFVKNKTWKLSSSKPTQVAIVGEKEEAERVKQLLTKINAHVQIVGFVIPNDKKPKGYLGNLAQIEEVISIHSLEELIFCSKDVKANQIIDLMVELNSSVSYKIVPDESNYVIGSASKNASGDLYTIDIKLNISEKANIRNKRILDISLSVLYLLLSPVLIWFVNHKIKSLKNTLSVLSGKFTWIGYKNNHDVNLPKIKKGIISPKETSSHISDYDYAKDYSLGMDTRLFFNSFHEIGN